MRRLSFQSQMPEAVEGFGVVEAHRNALVANLEHRVLFAHAAPGSKTEAFARKLAATDKLKLKFVGPANATLVEQLGAQLWDPERLRTS